MSDKASSAPSGTPSGTGRAETAQPFMLPKPVPATPKK